MQRFGRLVCADGSVLYLHAAGVRSGSPAVLEALRREADRVRYIALPSDVTAVPVRLGDGSLDRFRIAVE